MIIYILSDTHGHIDEFLNKVEEIGKPDMIFFLGDYIEDGIKIEQLLNIDTVMIKGNNDFKYKNYDYEKIIELNNYKIFLTHGHLYDVAYDINNLYYRGLELGADIVFFGHTHRAINIVEDDMIILNPGSPSFPRTVEGEKTFIKLTIDNGLEYEFIKINEK